MKRAISSPGKYIQGENILEELASYAATLGKKGVYGIMGPSALRKYGEVIRSSFAKGQMSLTLEEFARECSKSEIKRLTEAVKSGGCDVVLGMGGGKALDTAKAVAYYCSLPVIIIPSAASSDAPCSALSVIYTDDGQFEEYLILPKNPDMVMLDSNVIANAPPRLLVAGMGDALATYYEARSAMASGALSMAGGLCSPTALALAATCRDILFSNGYKAKLAAEAQSVSQALENIIEANTYLSGIGFESGGLGAAHAIHNGLTVLEETHSMLHGEKVAFGTITHLVLENAPLKEIEELILFCKKLGLPTTLAGIGITDPAPKKIMSVAKAACAEGETIHNMPFQVTPEAVYSAIIVADKLGAQGF